MSFQINALSSEQFAKFCNYDDTQISYIHMHFTKPGCFAADVSRV